MHIAIHQHLLTAGPRSEEFGIRFGHVTCIYSQLSVYYGFAKYLCCLGRLISSDRITINKLLNNN